MGFLVRLLINAGSLWAATWIVPGIHFTGTWLSLLGIALVFGGVNALIRPLVILMTCPFVIMTLGLGLLLINAGMLWLTASISGAMHLGLAIEGFWATLFGALVVSFVSTVTTALIKGDSEEKGVSIS